MEDSGRSRPDDEPGDSTGTVLGTTSADRLVVAVLLMAGLALLMAHWVQLNGFGTRPISVDKVPLRPGEYQLDLNQASWVELTQLDGIGPTLARRIVENREKQGEFAQVEDLVRVRGIGRRTIERLRPWLFVEGRSSGKKQKLLTN